MITHGLRHEDLSGPVTDRNASLSLSTDSPRITGSQDIVDVSVIMPCLNEEESVAACVTEALAAIDEACLEGEVLVVDNGSTDRSAQRAQEAGARVIVEARRGYGLAYMSGFMAARGNWIVCADSDGSHDFSDLSKFLDLMGQGADIVLGSRVTGQIDRGAIPVLHRYVGGPILTRLLNVLHGTTVSDAHCGFRSLRRHVLGELNLSTQGMEFASEMIIEAARCGLTMVEVPIHSIPRTAGVSKLRTWRDGWRHLRLIVTRSLASGDRDSRASLNQGFRADKQPAVSP